jgi:hypothetical protein
MTRTTPLRLTTLHFSQIGFTDGFTFTILFSLPATFSGSPKLPA